MLCWIPGNRQRARNQPCKYGGNRPERRTAGFSPKKQKAARRAASIQPKRMSGDQILNVGHAAVAQKKQQLGVALDIGNRRCGFVCGRAVGRLHLVRAVADADTLGRGIGIIRKRDLREVFRAVAFVGQKYKMVIGIANVLPAVRTGAVASRDLGVPSTASASVAFSRMAMVTVPIFRV